MGEEYACAATRILQSRVGRLPPERRAAERRYPVSHTPFTHAPPSSQWNADTTQKLMLWQGGVHKADGSACCDKTAASCKVGSTLPRTTLHAFESGAYWLASYSLRMYRNGTPTRVTTGDVACVCVCIYSCSVRARVCVCVP